MHYYVYLIQSIQSPEIFYAGYTLNIKSRLATHNAGRSIHTKKNKLWELIVCLAFKDKYIALKFEKYLKTHAGREFAKRRFLTEMTGRPSL